jgi:hypothetical protein
MDTIVIQAKNKSDLKFWLELAKKTGTKAKMINTDELEDAVLASLIEKGLTTPSVSRSSVMKALGK